MRLRALLGVRWIDLLTLPVHVRSRVLSHFLTSTPQGTS